MPTSTTTSTAVNAYVELPMTSESARVHATSKTMAAAPETAIAAGKIQAGLSRRNDRSGRPDDRSASGTRTSEAVTSPGGRREAASRSAAAARLAPAAIQHVARLPAAGRSQ